jgi:hypothetical protein
VPCSAIANGNAIPDFNDFSTYDFCGRVAWMAKRQTRTVRRKSSADAEMKAFLASKAVDQISDYSQRGRSYRALSDKELVHTWRTIWNELAADPLNTKTRDIQADLSSEFTHAHASRSRLQSKPSVGVRTRTPASASNTLSCQQETLHSKQLRSIKNAH